MAKWAEGATLYAGLAHTAPPLTLPCAAVVPRPGDIAVTESSPRKRRIDTHDKTMAKSPGKRLLQNKVQSFNYLCGTIKRTLLNRAQQEIILKFYKVLAVPALLYDSECRTVTKQHRQQIESSEMWFLRSVAGCRRTDEKRNTEIRQNLKKIFNLGEKIRECQQNYFERILRMPTYRIPRKIFNYHPKGRRDRGRPPMRWMDQFA
jgi:hypothetical protein